MVRCTKCRFLFEPDAGDALPECRQCGGATIGVLAIEPSEVPAAQPTMKIAIIKADAAR